MKKNLKIKEKILKISSYFSIALIGVASYLGGFIKSDTRAVKAIDEPNYLYADEMQYGYDLTNTDYVVTTYGSYNVYLKYDLTIRYAYDSGVYGGYSYEYYFYTRFNLNIKEVTIVNSSGSMYYSCLTNIESNYTLTDYWYDFNDNRKMDAVNILKNNNREIYFNLGSPLTNLFLIDGDSVYFKPTGIHAALYFNDFDDENEVYEYSFVADNVLMLKYGLSNISSSILSTSKSRAFNNSFDIDSYTNKNKDTILKSLDNGFEAYNDGYYYGYRNGYDAGKTAGILEGQEQDEVITSIFDGILSIGVIPFEFFLSIFNFTIFGIYIGDIIRALLTIAVVIIISRFVSKGKGD